MLSRNKVAVPEGAAGTPPFWSWQPLRTAAEDVPQGRLRQGRGASALGIHLNRSRFIATL